MKSGKILALDVGTKRTGVAISDEDQIFAFPMTAICTPKVPAQLAEIERLVRKDKEITHILVGIPMNQHGEVSQMGKQIRRFTAELKKRVSLPIIEWDESYTSYQAEQTLIQADISRKKRKSVVDKLAASILLQNYLDRLKSSASPDLIGESSHHESR